MLHKIFQNISKRLIHSSRSSNLPCPDVEIDRPSPIPLPSILKKTRKLLKSLKAKQAKSPYEEFLFKYGDLTDKTYFSKHAVDESTCSINSVIYDMFKTSKLNNHDKKLIENHLLDIHYPHRLEDFSKRINDTQSKLKQLNMEIKKHEKDLEILKNRVKNAKDFKDEMFWNRFYGQL